MTRTARTTAPQPFAFDETPIRLRADGSIDTAFYMARSRRMRAEQAAQLADAAPRATGSLISRLLRRLAGGPAALPGKTA